MKKTIFALSFLIVLAGCNSNETRVQTVSINSKEDFETRCLDGGSPNVLFVLKKDIDFGGDFLDKEKLENHCIKLDGNKHAIKNLTISSATNASLFGKIVNSEISNLKLSNIKVIGTRPGILASESNGSKFTNVTIDASCEIGDGSSEFTGGLVGYALDSEFTSCTNNGKVSGLNFTGGIVGKSLGFIKKCKNYGEVTTYGEKDCGGIVGYASNNNYNNRDKNICEKNTNYGSVKGLNCEFIGGCAGEYANDISVDKAKLFVKGEKNYGTVEGKQCVGGCAGRATCYTYSSWVTADESNYITITNCENYGTIKGSRYVGGIAGRSSNQRGQFLLCKNSFNTGEEKILGECYVGGIVGIASTVKNSENNMNIEVTALTNSEGIDTSSEHKKCQYAIGGIVGNSFTSKSELISNVNRGNIYGYQNGGTTREGVSIGGISGLCGGGTIVNNNSTGNIYASSCAGGIIGTLKADNASTVSNCNANCTLEVGNNSGGIVGYFLTGKNSTQLCTITTCTYQGEEVKSYDSGYFGGITGKAYVDLSTFVSSDAVAHKLSIINCTATFTYFGDSNCVKKVIGYNYIYNSSSIATVDDASNNQSTATRLGSL